MWDYLSAISYAIVYIDRYVIHLIILKKLATGEIILDNFLPVVLGK